MRRTLSASRGRGAVVARPALLYRLALLLLVLAAGSSVLASAPAASAQPRKADPHLYSAAARHPGARFGVIVRETHPRTADAEALVRSLGGHVTAELTIVRAFSADVPGRAVEALTASSSVMRVWGDGRIHMSTVDMDQYDTYPVNTVWRDTINLLQALLKADGSGVGVAVLDTGVVPMPDLQNQVAYRVDYTPEHDGLDRYGHGTHMAGIIAGDGTSSAGHHSGVAPGANLISIKVAGYNGATDVSVVIAGLQWAIAHRSQFNIRVLNLSFGTDSTQSYSIDPLDYAVEQAWKAGIAVVVSAGNRGPDSGTVDKPADDPYVISVGAVDTKQTTSPSDDAIAPFSAKGPTQDGLDKPNLVAPGISIVSVRDPNSTIDQQHPAARVGDSYFKGTGTSQSAAIVSGVAALLIQRNPLLSPDQVKATLMRTATRLPNQPGSGAGEVNAGAAVNLVSSLLGLLSSANGGTTPSTGTGSLEASRGSLHVYADTNNDGRPDYVSGEIMAFGSPWTAKSWSANDWSQYAWTDASWSADAWGAKSWSGMDWSAKSWSANHWSGGSWSSDAWSAKSWSAKSWSSNDWAAKSWSAKSWSASTWN